MPKPGHAADTAGDTHTTRVRADLTVGSRLLHRVDSFTARTGTAVCAGAAVFIAIIAIFATGFDTHFQAVFATICSGITVAMLFVLQHTHRRAQLATQLKLDELVHAMPKADNRIVHIEASTEQELVEREEARKRMHIALRVDS
jgi:low affinity Fe/Cu permease